MKTLFTLIFTLCLSTLATAKLPAASEEVKAKAAETAAKTAWSGKNDSYALCKSQDKVAASYVQTAKTSGKELKTSTTTPPCADPGPFVYVAGVAPAAAASAPKAKPLEAAGAHSPTPTAASPPQRQADGRCGQPCEKTLNLGAR